MAITDLLQVMLVFIWTGFVGAISFMESWIKFRAPGISVAVALSVGKLVFRALNRVEWVFMLLVGVCLIAGGKFTILSLALFLIIFVLLVSQTFFLLPLLGRRAAAYRAESPARPGIHHLLFAGAEVIKVMALIIYGINIF